MKRTLVFFIVLLPLWSFARANSSQAIVDSILCILPRFREDTNKVKLLSFLSHNYFLISPDEGLRYGQQGLNLAQRLRWKKGMASCYLSLATNYVYKPNSPKSFECYIKFYQLSEELNDKKGMAIGLFYFGNIYVYYGNMPKALDYYTKAINMYKELEDLDGVDLCLTSIGNVYTSQGKLKLALTYLLKGLEMENGRGNSERAAVTTGDVGLLYARQSDYAAAIKYGQMALKLADENELIYYRAVNLCNIAGYYLDIIENKEIKPMAQVGSARKDAKLLLTATEYLNEALAISTKLHVLDVIDNCCINLIRAAKIRNDSKAALHYTEQHMAIKDTLYSKENRENVVKLEVQNEYYRQRLGDSLKAADKDNISKMQLQKQRQYSFLGITGSVLLLGFSFFIVRERSKTERERKKTNELAKRLQESLLQKEVLMKEIHHRVKNNLTVISALLDLQLDNISDENAKRAVVEGVTRVKSISLIHHQLYMNEDIAKVEFSKFAGELSSQITSIFKLPGQEVSLYNLIPSTYLDIDTAVALGLILNELMTNSYKYAFPGADGDMAIKLERADDYFVLYYSDSGPGIPEKNIRGDTLGMMVMESLSKQLGGSLIYDYAKKVFVLRFMDITGRKKIA